MPVRPIEYHVMDDVMNELLFTTHLSGQVKYTPVEVCESVKKLLGNTPELPQKSFGNDG